MKTVLLLFSHNTLARRWHALTDTLASDGIELIALSQNSEIDWTKLVDETLAKASVVYFEATSRFVAYREFVDTVNRSSQFVVGGGMDATADLTEPRAAVADLFQRYLATGEPEDLQQGIHALLFAAGTWKEKPEPPSEAQLCGIASGETMRRYSSVEAYLDAEGAGASVSIVPLLYGRRYWTCDDMQAIADVQRSLRESGFQPLPIFCDFSIGNRINEADHPVAKMLIQLKDRIVALLNLAISNQASDGPPDRLFQEIGVPVLQLVRDYGRTESEWMQSDEQLMGMAYSFSVSQPESIGTIEAHMVACNEHPRSEMPAGETPRAAAVKERLQRLGRRLLRWQKLQQLANAEKRVCIFLNNSPCKSVEATLGCAAGLDALQSAVDIMRRMEAEGYQLENVPVDGKDLLERIRSQRAYSEFRWTNVQSIVKNGGVLARVGEREYRRHFDELPEDQQAEIDKAWGAFPAKSMVYPNDKGEPELLVVGLSFGNVAVMVEPKRGCWGARCDGEVCRILHQPDIAPTHHWLATAWWVQDHFDVVVHMGSESSTDFLPGKSAALSSRCYPDISLGELPRLYPHIMDSVGEGLLAKRRGKAVLISHLTPPTRRVGDFDAASEQLLELHRQLMHACSYDQTGRADALRIELLDIMRDRGLLAKEAETEEEEEAIRMLPRNLDRIRSRTLEVGKHVLGRVPDEAAMRLYVAESERFDAYEENDLRGRLSRTEVELEQVMRGLNGGFIPTGQSGPLSSGRDELLPSGRNFYAQDMHAVPTPAAWKVGVEMGEQLLSKYLTDEGEFPETIGVTLWSSDAFMAEGELTAQCLWLLGCRPRWKANGRIEGVETVPLDEMVFVDAAGTEYMRPRVDVVVRMSGVVRDLLEPVYLLLDDAVEAVSTLEESVERNFVRKHVNERLAELEQAMPSVGLSLRRRLASGRLFTDRSGSYGAGVGLAVDASAWNQDKDLANAFVNWTGGLCGRNMDTVVQKLGKRAVMTEFTARMSKVDVAYQRAVSPQYDALSIGCYSGYQGGMAATGRALGGKNPKLYWGDSQGGKRAEVRALDEEIDLALAARFMTPQWLEEKMKEGYAGAADVSGLVNTLFAWSATSRVVEKKHFDLVTRKILQDEPVREWLLETNQHAMEEITRRLLEAYGRKLWKADDDLMDTVRDVALRVEGDIEEGMGEAGGEFQGASVDVMTQDDVSEWKWELELK